APVPPQPGRQTADDALHEGLRCRHRVVMDIAILRSCSDCYLQAGEAALADDADTDRSAFDAQLSVALDGLSPAEQRVARLFLEQKEAILLGSAAQIGALVGASDATVVRTAQSLGFESLAALREAALADLTGRPTPGGRLRRTLNEVGGDAV